MPVVRVQDLRVGRDLREGGERGSTKKSEAPGVIRIVAPVVSVDARPIEEIGMLDEEHARAGGRRRDAVEPRLFGASAEDDGKRLPGAFDRRGRFAHALIQRHDHGGRVACGRLHRRQTAHRFTETAGTGERPVLGRQVRDADPLGGGDLWHVGPSRGCTSRPRRVPSPRR